MLAADFEIGHFIRERIVPRAVLYFTGEAIEDDDDDVSTPLRACGLLFVHHGCAFCNLVSVFLFLRSMMRKGRKLMMRYVFDFCFVIRATITPDVLTILTLNLFILSDLL